MIPARTERRRTPRKMIFIPAWTWMTLFLAMALFLPNATTVRKEYSSVDALRNQLIELDLSLQRKLFDPKWTDVPVASSIREALEAYDVIGSVLEEPSLEVKEEHLAVLDPIWSWARMKKDMRTIEGLYETFRRERKEALQGQGPVDVDKWVSFAKTILDDPNASVPAALSRMADIVVLDKLFMSAYKEGTFRICNQQQSPQELLYTMYNTIALTETKALAVVQFSYNILRLFKQGNFTEEMKVQKEAYESRMYQTLRAVRTAMAHAPRDLWRCDPAEHKPESTYTELKQVFQSYVINEVDMNRDKTCRESCGFYNYAKVEGCYENQFCSRQRRCNGRLINCQYVDSDMWICPSERNSDRRYEYIEYENGRVLGKKDTCTRETVKVDSWWRWLFWHCSYCICSCDDHNASSDRYFSLQAVVSDFANNKVITGIRLRKKNHIVYMQIKEGVLLPRGGINDSTTAWREIEEFSILDPDLVEGVDYYTLGWNQTEVDLDDVVGPSNHVLIGVKFRKLGSHLNLEVLTTPFNFTTGKLIRPHDNKLWHSNENTDNSDESKRSFLDIRKPDVPTQHNARSEPDSTHNQYLKFKTTDLDKDAGQTTVPFLDVQPIVPNPLVPLSGAGIFHKGSPGSGGFLALKIITYNFADHLHVDFAPSPVLDRNNEIGEIRVF
ncbi:uncharacterized protein LOC105696851 isoform X2 [Orussus abietinus]|uniref:uncharacterized protein LOC105696851 isoform X2 n=1 Tax=Orussus abietinus TaxID=222816 RepID=UPI000625BF76|nr:uncharacterized protein LOC105696851 isoform X2 [Orussus abietinus]